MVVVGKASGHHGPDLQHGRYGHILPQAPHWGPTRQHYNIGWPQGRAAWSYAGCTQGLQLGHARHGHDGTTSLAAQRLVLHDDFCEISNALSTVRLKSSQEQARMAGLHAGAREPCQTLGECVAWTTTGGHKRAQKSRTRTLVVLALF